MLLRLEWLWSVFTQSRTRFRRYGDIAAVEERAWTRWDMSDVGALARYGVFDGTAPLFFSLYDSADGFGSHADTWM